VLVDGEETDAGEFRPAPLPQVAVSVRAPAGVPLAGQHDFYTREPEVRRGRLLLDESGRGLLTGLPAGRWIARIEIRGASAETEFEVRPGLSLELELKAAPEK
jgi:hypothetical protein